MREIPILDDVQPKNVDGTVKENAKPVSMQAYVFGLLEDPKAVANFTAVCKSIEIRDAFKSVVPGGAVKLTEGNWEHLCSLAKEPTGGYTWHIYAMSAFIHSIVDAKKVDSA